MSQKANAQVPTNDQTTNLPVAYATAVADFSTDGTVTAFNNNNNNINNNNNVYVVDLPIGVPQIGIVFQQQQQSSSSPIIISDIDQTICPSTLIPQITIGHYCHGIILPGVEIVNIINVSQLNQLIQQNANTTRQLIVSPLSYYIDSSLTTTVGGGGGGAVTLTNGVLYKHTLPQGTLHDLGFVMTGFPPVITHVSPNSSMIGRLHLNQTVEALLIPGEPIFHLASGAFTSTKVQERLDASSIVTGRQLVMKDAPLQPREKGSNAMFDWKTFTNSSSWGLHRMLGMKKK